MHINFHQLITLSFGLIAIATPLGRLVEDSSAIAIRAADGDEYVTWPDDSVDESGLLVAAYDPTGDS
ncbi:hypothetical protein NHQ30_008236 [Ciborinia camelliae]|nr:hypothetical protein NHQ30_008236 [Ciborinia camelliae]